MSLLTLVLASFLGVGALRISYWSYCLLGNYLTARRMGVPVCLLPFDHTHRLWSIVDTKLLPFFNLLPFATRTSFSRYNWRGWEITDRYRAHHELGGVFAMVSPSRIWLYIGEPDAAAEVLRRGADFPRCSQLTVVEPSRWKVQRKIMSACFNEPNNEIVWSESLVLATDMLRYWAPKPSVNTVAEDMRTLSLHVLSRAGFGKSFRFQGHDERKASGSTSYKDSLQTILENCILILVLGPKFLAKPWLPRRVGNLQLGQVHRACVAFQQYMTDMYEEGKLAYSGPPSQTTTKTGSPFMTSLVHASQEEAKTSGGLTESEIYGNMFVLNFAGHDTITHTLTFAIYFMAANPTVQDWISEELHRVLGSRSSAEWSYKADFPRLKRCLSVLLETLRLYNPVPLAKWTDAKTVSLRVGDQMILIPPKTMVALSYSSLQTDPNYWSDDSLVWRPSRWIRIQNDSDQQQEEEEEIITPKRGTFLPWSDGIRDCPGRKFSQIEFVATMACLFRDWRVEPAFISKGESRDDARKRVLHQIKTDSAPVLLLQMLHPERSPLVWSRRQ
ncbi:Cytochrome P450 [Rhypophila decipiens]